MDARSSAGSAEGLESRTVRHASPGNGIRPLEGGLAHEPANKWPPVNVRTRMRRLVTDARNGTGLRPAIEAQRAFAIRENNTSLLLFLTDVDRAVCRANEHAHLEAWIRTILSWEELL